MSLFFSSSNIQQLKNAEGILLNRIAPKFRANVGSNINTSSSSSSSSDLNISIETFDTPISAQSIPLQSVKSDEQLTIHSIRVVNHSSEAQEHKNTTTPSPPLVLLHGYMNGAAFFYRNFYGILDSFTQATASKKATPNTIHSLDMLGWGLSSRPDFIPKTPSSQNGASVTATTESIFVESLEAWRKAQNIPKMILAGHSLGGYLSVAYCERYPQHVEHLILISPVGVPYETEEERLRRHAVTTGTSLTRSIAIRCVEQVFHWGVTPSMIGRLMGETRARSFVESYLKHRIPSIQTTTPAGRDEQAALVDYAYSANMGMKPSGERCLNKLLTPFAFAKVPLVDRIPKLAFGGPITMLYGEHDWMDPKGGLQVQKLCSSASSSSSSPGKNISDKSASPSSVSVYQIPNAGHMLMLDNWKGFNSVIIHALGGTPPPNWPKPKLL